MIEQLKEWGRNRRLRQPTYPDARRQWVGILLIFCSILVIDRTCTYLGYLWRPAGTVYLLLVVFVACWSGLRAALIGCGFLIAYVWLITHYRISIFPQDQTKIASTIITTAIFYPLFAIIAGVVQGKLRNAAMGEFEARRAAQAAEVELGFSEEMRRLIVDSTTDAVIAMDHAGTITLWNPHAEQLFGWSTDEAIGQKLTEKIIPERMRENVVDGLTKFLDTGQSQVLNRTVELPALTKSGREVEVEASIVPHQTADGYVFVGFLRDISERKRVENAIRELNVNLERRVAERTEQLEMANADLVGFTYSISHDLRAPLRGIVGNCRILFEDAKGQLDGESLARLKRLESGALKMAELIDSLLTFSRIGQTAIKVEEVDLSAMAQSIAEELQSSKPGNVIIEPGLTARGDHELLRIVMLNLLENAWKYVQPGEAPSVEVGRAPDGSIFVSDHGIGFDMRYVDKIWKPFERLHHDHEYPGTGIGLANSKRIVERHGGDMWVESEPGRGTTFYFSLTKPEAVKAPVRRAG